MGWIRFESPGEAEVTEMIDSLVGSKLGVVLLCDILSPLVLSHSEFKFLNFSLSPWI